MTYIQDNNLEENDLVKELLSNWHDVIGTNNPRVVPQNLRFIPTRIKQKIPSKLEGRKGTRKRWNRLHPPRLIYLDLTSVELLDCQSEPSDGEEVFSLKLEFT